MADQISIQVLIQYRVRFGHGPPPWIGRSLRIGLWEPDEVNRLMSDALRSGEPVRGWAGPPENDDISLY